MPIGRLSREDRQRLSDHFWTIVQRVCVEHDCWPGEVLNRLRKSHGIKGISPARAQIVREMRETAFTYYSQPGTCQLWLSDDEPELPDATFERLVPVSLPLLARMIGCDHSTLVLAQQRLTKVAPEPGNAAAPR